MPIDRCPNCGYEHASGGRCPECGLAQHQALRAARRRQDRALSLIASASACILVALDWMVLQFSLRGSPREDLVAALVVVVGPQLVVLVLAVLVALQMPVSRRSAYFPALVAAMCVVGLVIAIWAIAATKTSLTFMAGFLILLASAPAWFVLVVGFFASRQSRFPQ